MLGCKSHDSLFELFSILYFIEVKGPVSRDDISQFLLKLRKYRAAYEPDYVPNLRVADGVAISRQITLLRREIGVKVKTSPKRGIEFAGWGFINGDRFHRWMNHKADFSKLFDPEYEPPEPGNVAER